MIYPWIVSVAIAVASVVLFSSGSEKEADQVVEQQVVAARAEEAATISRAIVMVGLCSVLCSLIWGSSIVIVSNNKRKGVRPCRE